MQFIVHSLAAAAIGALLKFPIAPAFARTVAECNTEYAANKAYVSTIVGLRDRALIALWSTTAQWRVPRRWEIVSPQRAAS